MSQVAQMPQACLVRLLLGKRQLRRSWHATRRDDDEPQCELCGDSANLFSKKKITQNSIGYFALRNCDSLRPSIKTLARDELLMSSGCR